MAVENFTTYTEVDPNTHIAKTATRVTWTDLARDEDAYVYKDKGVDFFSGGFTHLTTINITAGDVSSSLFSTLWMIADAVDSYDGIFGGVGNNALSLDFYYTGTHPRLELNENVGNSNTQSGSPYEITLDTPYYLKIVRDESVGTYGTLYCYIYSDSSHTALLDTLSLTLTVKNDFRYIYPIASYNTTNANKHSGYSENLDLAAGLSAVTTQAVSGIVTTTATGNGNITDLGDPTATQHGHCWNTAGTPTTSDDKTANGVPSATGAFTSSLTGLTSGVLYYVRAYATNAIGTSYGGEVNFVAGSPLTGELRGVIAVVEERLHYLDAYGNERYLEGTIV